MLRAAISARCFAEGVSLRDSQSWLREQRKLAHGLTAEESETFVLRVCLQAASMTAMSEWKLSHAAHADWPALHSLHGAYNG